MTMAYDPHREWNDGLTHVDSERIRSEGIAYALAALHRAMTGDDSYFEERTVEFYRSA